MAGKLLLLLGLAAGAAVLSSSTAHAHGAVGPGGGPPAPLPPHPDGFDVNNPPDDVKKLILQATTSLNPALMRSTADQLDTMGYKPQAGALRAAADAIDLAQKSLPPAGTPPGQPVIVPVPGGGTVTLPPVTSLPTGPASPAQPSTPGSGADPLAAKLTAALNLADPIANGITASPEGIVSAFQAQERKRGTYTGALDGLYGSGVASAVAGYNIVPYPPFIWSKDKKKTAAAKATFKSRMLAKAANDPTRAEEWARVAQLAQNT